VLVYKRENDKITFVRYKYGKHGCCCHWCNSMAKSS
jgi:hypothetical protein